jgi:hypothetical protein
MQLSRDLRTILLRRAEEVLEDYPGLGHVEVNDEQERVTLTFPRQTEGGFDVVVEATREETILFASGAHVQFDIPHDPDHNLEMQVEEALGLARDLLSPTMRIRERCAGGKPYRWYVEYLDDAQWRAEHETVLLFWNYFGRRSERIYRNSTLPSRTSGNPQARGTKPYRVGMPISVFTNVGR